MARTKQTSRKSTKGKKPRSKKQREAYALKKLNAKKNKNKVKVDLQENGAEVKSTTHSEQPETKVVNEPVPPIEAASKPPTATIINSEQLSTEAATKATTESVPLTDTNSEEES